MPRIILTLTVLALSIVAAGCGGDGGSGSSDAATLAPANSFFYAETTLDPEGSQQEAIDDLVAKFPGEGTLGERIGRLANKELAENDSDLSWEEDYEPWLGDEAALFVSDMNAPNGEPAAAGLIAVEDEGDAEEAIEQNEDGAEKSEHNGRDMYVLGDGDTAAAVLDGWLVLGNLRGVKDAIDTAEGGEQLADDERYQSAVEDAADDRLGYFYVNMPALLEQLENTPAAGQLGPMRRFFSQSLLATFDVDEDAVLFESMVPAEALAGFPFVSEGSDMATELPADSWLAMAQPELGKTIDWYIDAFAGAAGGRDFLARQLRQTTGLDLERDVISWMGDWGVFVRGTSIPELDGAVVVETTDPAASRRFIDTMARLGRRTASEGESVEPFRGPAGGEGYTLRMPESPKPIHLFQSQDKVVVAFGDEAARAAVAPDATLGEAPEFAAAQDALGGDYTVSMYVQIAPILALVQPAVAADGGGAEFEKALPYLEPLGALVGGARKEGDKLRSAFGLTFE